MLRVLDGHRLVFGFIQVWTATEIGGHVETSGEEGTFDFLNFQVLENLVFA